MKSVNEPMSQAPAEIGLEYRSAYFCDWTDQQTLLANVSMDGQKWKLVVFDKSGRLLQTLNTAVPPSKGVVASWRRYWHQ